MVVDRQPDESTSKGLGGRTSISQGFEKFYAPLTAGLLAPFRGDRLLPDEKRCTLDRLYQRICDDLDALLRTVSLNIAA
jgi:hypothetical protein